MEEGEELSGSIAVRKNKKNHRHLDIKLSYHYDGRFKHANSVNMYKLQ